MADIYPLESFAREDAGETNMWERFSLQGQWSMWSMSLAMSLAMPLAIGRDK
ncbi:hypothetical protein [Pontixanthobacter aquaemixtae]|uniref:Uncharacterized protein n=1 Tax=Pontixanthobacter aquaemixtae TaxID=1958940 RepID=A0A844ZTK8_9SPHN|nr:hypothetical protein [Pontixanthobacter aquaemixtae]MXO91273.1 hypothetical protein [Pontixanthobacter aquaemixtae]